MNIFLIVCIPLTLWVGCYFVLESFKLGVKTKGTDKLDEKKESFQTVEVDEERQKHFQQIINEYLGN